MKPVFQTRFGTAGNCWAACLATLFEVPLEEVDHCAMSETDWYRATCAWLAKRGLFHVEVFIHDHTLPPPFTAPPDGTLLICGCLTERPLAHVVIGRFDWVERNEKGECTRYELVIVHDPIGPAGGKEYLVDAFFFFCPITKA